MSVFYLSSLFVTCRLMWLYFEKSLAIVTGRATLDLYFNRSLKQCEPSDDVEKTNKQTTRHSNIHHTPVFYFIPVSKSIFNYLWSSARSCYVTGIIFRCQKKKAKETLKWESWQKGLPPMANSLLFSLLTIWFRANQTNVTHGHGQIKY